MKKFISHVQYTVIAFGGAGAQILRMLSKLNLPTSRLHLFDTDKTEIDGHGISGRHLLGRNLLNGKGTFATPSLGKVAYEDGKDYLDKISNDDHLFIITGALGGGTFSAMAPLFAETLRLKRKKFIVVAKWPDGEEVANIGNAHDALVSINDSTDKVLLYMGDVVKSRLAIHGKENGYQEINKKISNDIKDLLDQTSTRIIESNIAEEMKLYDNYNRIKAYIDDYEWIVGQDDDALYLSRTNVALLDSIHSGRTQLYMNTSRKFEELTAEILVRAGYETILTGATRDNGVDIRLKMFSPFTRPVETIVQTKMKGEGKKIARQEVQQLEGARMGAKADTAMFVSSVDYSRDSIKYALEQKIDLHLFFDLLEEYKLNYEGRVMRFPKNPNIDTFTEAD